MVHLDNDAFLTRLAEFFEQTREKGTVFITMKRLSHRRKQKPAQHNQDASAEPSALEPRRSASSSPAKPKPTPNPSSTSKKRKHPTAPASSDSDSDGSDNDADPSDILSAGDAPYDPAAEYPCILRAKCGKKKLSTVVKAEAFEIFQERYGGVVRAGMDSLKKKDKDKKPAGQARGAKKQKTAGGAGGAGGAGEGKGVASGGGSGGKPATG